MCLRIITLCRVKLKVFLCSFIYFELYIASLIFDFENSNFKAVENRNAKISSSEIRQEEQFTQALTFHKYFSTCLGVCQEAHLLADSL